MKRKGRERALALAILGVSCAVVLGSVELILRVTGHVPATLAKDPFNGFDGASPIYTQQYIPDKGQMYVPASHAPAEVTQSFAVHEEPNTFRIFTFGGSTTRGVPWGTEGSFSAWLEKYLHRLYPHWNIEVINCGVSGYGSSRVLILMKEMLSYSPDLFIVYSGQNEFREAAFHSKEITRSAIEVQLTGLLYRSATYSFVVDRVGVLKELLFGPRLLSYAAVEIDRVLSSPYSRESFRAFDYHRVPDLVPDRSVGKGLLPAFISELMSDAGMHEEEVYAKFRENVWEMVEITESADVPLIFLLKARNPKEVSLQREYRTRRSSLRAGSEDSWKELFHRGIEEAKDGRCAEAVTTFEAVLKLYDSPTAKDTTLVHLYAGECYERLGDYERAAGHYESRLDRRHHNLNRQVREILEERGVPSIDAGALLSEHAENGIVGYENYFVDSAHMTLEGYRLIGRALAQWIQRNGYLEDELGKGDAPEVDPQVNGDVSVAGMAAFDTVQVWTSLGWSAFNRGKTDHSVAYAKRAIEKDPTSLQAHLLLGYAYTKLERYEDARAEWEILERIWKGKEA